MTIAYKTKTDVVCEKLRQDIIGGRLKPGQRIIITEAAKEFGLSEIPVREAIRKLESEGFVQFTPHVGAVVSTIDEREFLEIYLIRIELEVLATKLAVEHITPAVIERLTQLIERADTAIEQNEHEKLGPLNKDFHLTIYRAAPYPYLIKLIMDLWDKFELTQSVFAYVPKRAVPSWDEHKKIVEALKNKNSAAASRFVREQKHRTMKALERYLAGNGLSPSRQHAAEA